MSAGKGNNTDAIHVAIGFDKNFLRQAYALISSLMIHHDRGEIEIHAITEDISDCEKLHITKFIGNFGNGISFYIVDPSVVRQFVLASQWTAVVYYRLFFAVVIRKPIVRLLYLDCDTLVTNSLRPLYNSRLDGHPVAAVYDNYVKVQPLLNIVEEGEYFNSGVLLMDVPQWKQQQISERAFEYLKEHPENILFVDQCALNFVLRKNWKKLDVRFNFMYSCLPEAISKKDLKRIMKNNVVVHFTLQRPWQMLCKNRLRDLYFYYLKLSGTQRSDWHGYHDFQISKIPAWIRIRLHEFYFDAPLLQRVWRFIQLR